MNDAKKSSRFGKLTGMLKAAKAEGQTPTRWIMSAGFKTALFAEMTGGLSLPFSSDTFLGLPITVNVGTVHDCILDFDPAIPAPYQIILPLEAE